MIYSLLVKLAFKHGFGCFFMTSRGYWGNHVIRRVPTPLWCMCSIWQWWWMSNLVVHPKILQYSAPKSRFCVSSNDSYKLRDVTSIRFDTRRQPAEWFNTLTHLRTPLPSCAACLALQENLPYIPMKSYCYRNRFYVQYKDVYVEWMRMSFRMHQTAIYIVLLYRYGSLSSSCRLWHSTHTSAQAGTYKSFYRTCTRSTDWIVSSSQPTDMVHKRHTPMPINAHRARCEICMACLRCRRHRRPQCILLHNSFAFRW